MAGLKQLREMGSSSRESESGVDGKTESPARPFRISGLGPDQERVLAQFRDSQQEARTFTCLSKFIRRKKTATGSAIAAAAAVRGTTTKCRLHLPLLLHREPDLHRFVYP